MSRAVLALLVLVGIGLRVYKADYTGIVFDEALSALRFGTLEAALNNYEHANNHVLNSLAIALERMLFPDWAHAIRLHSVLSGAGFVLCSAWILRRAVDGHFLRWAGLALVTLHWFVFDLSFLARGYAIALCALAAGTAVVLADLRSPSGRSWWRTAVALILVDVIALGAMLSAAPFVFGLNAAWLVGAALRSGQAWRLRTSLGAGLVLGLGAAGGLAPLYAGIWRQILAKSDNYSQTGFGSYLYELLVGISSEKAGTLALISGVALITFALLGLVAQGRRPAGAEASAVLGAPGMLLAAVGPMANKGEDVAGDAPLAVWKIFAAITGLSLAGMALARLAGVSLGFPRNGVFLLPPLFTFLVVLVDGLRAALVRQVPGRAWDGALALAPLGLLLANVPSPFATQVARFEAQSVAGPLVRELIRLDPQRSWHIRMNHEARYLNLPLDFYRAYGFRCTHTLMPDKDADVVVWFRRDEEGERAYRPELFEPFDCVVKLRRSAAPGS